MNTKKIPESELILNPDGSIYHLNLLPQDLAPTIILVGDPERVAKISKHFDSVEVKKQNREFITHTGKIGQLPISVMSTGIGIGSIDIVLNEVDALFNIDLNTRQVKKDLTSVRFVRLGTTGCLVREIPTDSFVVSSYALAFDGLLKFYQTQYNDDENKLLNAIQQHFASLPVVGNAYVAQTQSPLYDTFRKDCYHGITWTCSGFYGPQYRHLRTSAIEPNIYDLIDDFEFNGEKITNLEMESACIYGLSRLLNHEAISISLIINNRPTGEFTKDMHGAMEKLITLVLEKLSLSST